MSSSSFNGLLDPLDFESVQPIEVPVTIAGQRYTLREATGEAADRWRNAQVSRAVFDSESRRYVSPGGLAGTDAVLVAACLTPTVTVEQVLAWPTRVRDALFERAKAISGLTADEEPTEESLEGDISFLQEKLERLRQYRENGTSKAGQERLALKN